MLRFDVAALAAVICAPACARRDTTRPLAEDEWRAASGTDPVCPEIIPGMAFVATDDAPRTDDFRMGNEPDLRSDNEKTNGRSLRLPPPREKRPVNRPHQHAAGRDRLVDGSHVQGDRP
jgi:hypothetical protein